VRRLAALALAAGLAAGCSTPEPAACPGTPVAAFHFEGALLPAFDPDTDPLFPGLPNCTPDPLDTAAPVQYPPTLTFDATLAADPETDVAALCRANGSVLSGARVAPLSFEVAATAEGAVLCDSGCAAALQVVVQGDVVLDPGGGPATFHGILVEALTQLAGACDACLPAVPEADPVERACAARYELSGTAF
jgi:hypothetical protein